MNPAKGAKRRAKKRATTTKAFKTNMRKHAARRVAARGPKPMQWVVQGTRLKGGGGAIEFVYLTKKASWGEKGTARRFNSLAGAAAAMKKYRASAIKYRLYAIQAVPA